MKGENGMPEYRYDTQMLIEGRDLDEDVISDYFTEHFQGDCLLAAGQRTAGVRTRPRGRQDRQRVQTFDGWTEWSGR